MQKVDDDVLEFLWESNKIEREHSEAALSDAVDAWCFFTEVNKCVFSYPSFLHTHYMLMRNIDVKIAGEVRDHDVFIGGKACRFVSKSLIVENLEAVAKGINRSIAEFISGTPEEMNAEQDFEAKQLHVDFEHIHPFADGNGRTGRIIYNAHRLKLGLPLHIIHEGKEQQEYYGWFREGKVAFG